MNASHMSQPMILDMFPEHPSCWQIPATLVRPLLILCICGFPRGPYVLHFRQKPW